MDQHEQIESLAELRATTASDRRADCCPNCDVSLRGRFCCGCGQDTRSNNLRLRPFLAGTARELLELDGRVFRTLWLLLIFPGRLANDYLRGRRRRYISPTRMFLFSSLVLLLCARFATEDKLANVVESNAATLTVAPELLMLNKAIANGASQEQKRRAAFALVLTLDTEQEELPTEEDLDSSIRALSSVLEDAAAEQNMTPPEYMDFYVSNLPSGKRMLRASGEDGAARLVSSYFDYVSKFILLFMVLLAVALKLLYRRRHYVEHTVLCMYALSSFWLMIAVALLAKSPYLALFLACVFQVQLLLAQRQMYGQSWLRTLGKGTVVVIAECALIVAILGASGASAVWWM